ncbi:MAG: DNA-processing protein DprA, partial [Oscillospiraceae bacterium]|nr:DNA-processing protein DprA [Oscillospiraceae bacterium]
MSSLKYWVWLGSASGLGSVAAGLLLGRFGTPEKVFFASEEEYRSTEAIKPSDVAKLMRKDIAAANKILASCAEIGCRVISIQDAEYPDRLRNIYDPPVVLYVRGNLPVIDEEAAVAIVGTRNCTPYGLTAAEDIGYRLARRGLLVVTGLARGIDTAAARGALRGGGSVVGVIGSG